MLFTNVTTQLNYASEIYVCCPLWFRTDLQFDRTTLSDQVVLREPSQAQWLAEVTPRYTSYMTQQEWAAFTNLTEPGRTFVVPAYTASVPSVNITVPAYEVTIPAYRQSVSLKVNRTTIIPLNIPAQTITIPAKSLTATLSDITIPSRTVVYNSTSGRLNVKRANWTAPLQTVMPE